MLLLVLRLWALQESAFTGPKPSKFKGPGGCMFLVVDTRNSLQAWSNILVMVREACHLNE